MQWAMATLQHDEDQAVDYPIDDGRGGATFPSLRALREASSQAAEMIQEPLAAANSRCAGDGGTAAAGNNISGTAPRRSSSGSAVIQPLRWNFGAGAAAPPGRDGVPVPAEAAATGSLLPDLVYGSPPTRRAAVLKSVGSIYAQDHIIAERKRREKINQRFIELSTVIPGLKKVLDSWSNLLTESIPCILLLLLLPHASVIYCVLFLTRRKLRRVQNALDRIRWTRPRSFLTRRDT